MDIYDKFYSISQANSLYMPVMYFIFMFCAILSFGYLTAKYEKLKKSAICVGMWGFIMAFGTMSIVMYYWSFP